MTKISYYTCPIHGDIGDTLVFVGDQHEHMEGRYCLKCVTDSIAKNKPPKLGERKERDEI